MQFTPELMSSFLLAVWAAAIVSCPALGDPQPAPQPAPGDQDKSSRVAQFKAAYGSHLEPILAKIGASPEQRKQITAIVLEYKPKIEPLRVEYKQKSQEFLNFIVTGMPAEKVMARQGELNKLYSVIVSQYSLMRLEIRRYLTSDQCRLFEQYRAQQGWSSH